MKRKENLLSASFTVEATYLIVFIYISILLIIYLTFSIYNVSILTTNAYLLLLEKSECGIDMNENLENTLYEEACAVAKGKIVSTKTLQVETKTEFDQLSIQYYFVTNVPILDRMRTFFQNNVWEYKIKAVTNRIRIEESLRLMKLIRGGVKE